jgi:hypothetical protein
MYSLAKWLFVTAAVYITAYEYKGPLDSDDARNLNLVSTIIRKIV